MKVSSLLSSKDKNVITIKSNKTVVEAAKLMEENKIGALLVTDDKKKLKGIITERDILKECSLNYKNLESRMVSDAMINYIYTGTPEDEVASVFDVMTKNNIRHLPIIKNDEIVGILSMRDIFNAKLDNCEFEKNNLENYIKGGNY